jgi:protein tyrosine phosphatase (PTP) superfamily phosphohydrolase (DUF442 family)
MHPNLAGGTQPRPGGVILAFLYVWLMVGLFSGTAVLLGPAGWLSAAVQKAGWSEPAQGWALKALIALWFVATVPATIWMVRRVFWGERRTVRVGIPLTMTALALLAGAAWMDPSRTLAPMAGGSVAELRTEGGATFLFGPYPDRARLAQLKREGVVAVVSLQHPAVPVEVPGIAEERRATRELGLLFVHAPMLPWVSNNEASLRVVRDLVRTGTGKYYVHCGLGRDRVTVVRHLVERMGGRQLAPASAVSALTFADRPRQAAAGEIPSANFERGMLAELQPGVWLIPHPNGTEMFGYMLAGQVKHVVSVLDPADPEQRSWMEEQRRAFGQFGVAATYLPVRAGDTAQVARMVELVRRLPRPVAVIAPRTPQDGKPTPGTATAVAITRALTAPR